MPRPKKKTPEEIEELAEKEADKLACEHIAFLRQVLDREKAAVLWWAREEFLHGFKHGQEYERGRY